MADKKMNEFPAASDGAFVYAEDANGNQIKISKADLASVVAELMGFTGKIKTYKNTSEGAGSTVLFSNISSGMVFLIHHGGLGGRYNAMIFVKSQSEINIHKYNTGSESDYQSFTMSGGMLSIKNSGYGIGNFTAIYVG